MMDIEQPDPEFALTKTPSSFEKFRDSPAQRHIRQLLETSIILPDDWEALSPAAMDEVLAQDDFKTLLELLVKHGLLTDYQATRLGAGKKFGLILGNYRILSHLSSGGMGIIYKAEHVHMRRPVAIKVLPSPRNQNTRMLMRFFAEVRAVARLQHPNIVTAFDAGREFNADDPDSPVLHYMVMEYIPGEDLETYVNAHGPLPAGQACDLACQVASALAEADKHHLIHRDIKPSNIMVTPEGLAKLLDFGLVHHFQSRLTLPQMTIGTIEYIPPEQARDAAQVDIRADIYSLGGTLYWCLTGLAPFPRRGSTTQDLIRRQNQPPPSARTLRPEIPVELDAVLRRMMALSADDRYPSPASVLQALLPFRKHASREFPSVLGTGSSASWADRPAPQADVVHRILIVDDDASIRDLCRAALQSERVVCDVAEDGLAGLEATRTTAYDLLLLDIDMPELPGPAVLRHLRAFPPSLHVKIIMFSGKSSPDEMAEMLMAGADDFLTKPFSLIQLRSRVKSALRLKAAQDRSEELQRSLAQLNARLEENLSTRDIDFTHARNALILTIAKIIEHCAIETEGHLRRMQHYCRALAEEASQVASLTGQIDANFVHMLECCAPLHDIGKIGLPDHILQKSGKFDPQERVIMQTHTTFGADILAEIAKQHGQALGFLRMGIELVRHHHERYDGQGYPDRLAGDAVPLPARILAIADAYDALRSRGIGRPPLAHRDAVQIIAETSTGQFDPLLLQAFQRCALQFERVYREIPD
jgi:response regulator RpfG family c-di-GMP phosphodiesterase/serine/threonine protein kinase